MSQQGVNVTWFELTWPLLFQKAQEGSRSSKSGIYPINSVLDQK